MARRESDLVLVLLGPEGDTIDQRAILGAAGGHRVRADCGDGTVVVLLPLDRCPEGTMSATATRVWRPGRGDLEVVDEEVMCWCDDPAEL